VLRVLRRDVEYRLFYESLVASARLILWKSICYWWNVSVCGLLNCRIT